MLYLSLPKSLDSPDEFEQLIERYKAYRLLSLQLSPLAFGSYYEREAAFPRETWLGRLTGPACNNLVAVAGEPPEGPETDSIAPLFNQEWLGSLLLRGPFDKEGVLAEFGEYFGDSTPKTVGEGINSYFGLYAMYVLPTARGMGVGVGIVEYAKQEAVRMSNGARTRVILMLDPENPAARRTYAKAGFELKFSYWFDDYRQGRTGSKSESLVMMADVGGDEV
jgi:GNAT superfamily N-acetyltransferase